jgi:hypothetical integral membrane protein (TIGR02206 family)
MIGYPFQAFGPEHLVYMGALVVVWTVVVWFGRSLSSPHHRGRVVLVLAFLTLGQELVDDLIRATRGVWTVQEALPLHLCSLGMLVGVWAILTKRQLAFEVAYFWGLAAGSQAIITPDNSRWQLGELDVFWNFLSHGIVILNVLWLVYVEGMRCRRGSWWRVFLLTNLTMVPIAFLNLIIGSNYFFISRKPGGSSPFLMGDWPWYIIGFELVGLLFFWGLSLPMAWSVRRAAREVEA